MLDTWWGRVENIKCILGIRVSPFFKIDKIGDMINIKSFWLKEIKKVKLGVKYFRDNKNHYYFTC